MDDEFNVYRDVDREASRDYDPEPDEGPTWHDLVPDEEPSPVTRCAYCGWRITGSCDGRCLT